MKLKLLYHGHCFDGVASAAVFTRFYLAKINSHAEVQYAGLMHRPGNLFDATMFDGDENVIVDFKYSPSEKLTWWFDHHQSAFLSREDERHFTQDTSGKKFWDASRKSCTEFIYDTAHERFDFTDDSLNELIAWARKIDGALYDSAAEAVELKQSPLQLMQVIESVPDEDFIERIIRDLCTRSLDEVATSNDVQRHFRPIYDQHMQTLETIRRKATYHNGVVFFDLADEKLEGFNKFIPYYLFPETTYSVAVTVSTLRTKISVGSSPFSPRPRTHNIAEICERYGGGGHPVVGAISLGSDELEYARRVADEVVATLSSDLAS